MIWLEGAFGTPSAVRTNPRTITIRVKLVMSSTIDGASVSSVITMTICTATLIWAGRSVPSRLRFRRSGRAVGGGRRGEAGPGAGEDVGGGAGGLAAVRERQRQEEEPAESGRSVMARGGGAHRVVQGGQQLDPARADARADNSCRRRRRRPGTGGCRASRVSAMASRRSAARPSRRRRGRRRHQSQAPAAGAGRDQDGGQRLKPAPGPSWPEAAGRRAGRGG